MLALMQEHEEEEEDEGGALVGQSGTGGNGGSRSSCGNTSASSAGAAAAGPAVADRAAGRAADRAADRHGVIMAAVGDLLRAQLAHLRASLCAALFKRVASCAAEHLVAQYVEHLVAATGKRGGLKIREAGLAAVAADEAEVGLLLRRCSCGDALAEMLLRRPSNASMHALTVCCSLGAGLLCRLRRWRDARWHCLPDQGKITTARMHCTAHFPCLLTLHAR
jgi:hypothetical protein